MLAHVRLLVLSLSLRGSGAIGQSCPCRWSDGGANSCTPVNCSRAVGCCQDCWCPVKVRQRLHNCLSNHWVPCSDHREAIGPTCRESPTGLCEVHCANTRPHSVTVGWMDATSRAPSHWPRRCQVSDTNKSTNPNHAPPRTFSTGLGGALGATSLLDHQRNGGAKTTQTARLAREGCVPQECGDHEEKLGGALPTKSGCPNTSQCAGRSPATFHTWVFPAWTLMLECLHSSSSNCGHTSVTRSGCGIDHTDVIQESHQSLSLSQGPCSWHAMPRVAPTRTREASGHLLARLLLLAQ